VFGYSLGNEETTGQFSAAVFGPWELTGYDRVTFQARADRPMRASVQLRQPGSGERWRRSLYLDDRPRAVTIFFDDMTPVRMTSTPRPDTASGKDLMFVIDTTNTHPGTKGAVWIENPRLGR